MAVTQYDADVIVIGSGILGNLAAHEIAKAGKSVIILEAGPRVPRWQIVQNFRNNANANSGNRNDPYPSTAWAPNSFAKDYLTNIGPVDYRPGMLRLVGGTTWHWGGACWRNLPNDFKLKSLYGQGRDWPIGYDDLEKFYVQAEYEIGVSGSDTDDYSGRNAGPFPPRSAPYPVKPQKYSYLSQVLKQKFEAAGYPFTYQPNGRATDPYGERPACAGNNNCVPICPIGSQYSGDRHATKAERAGARLIDNALAFKLEKGEGGKISAVHYKNPKGEDTRLSARYIIAAAHSIETPRLLLLSEVANSSGLVGRNLMDNDGHSLTLLLKQPVWGGRGPVQQADVMKWRDGPFRAQHSAIRFEVDNGVGTRQVTERLLKQGVIGSELDKRIRHDAARFVSILSNFELLPNPANRVSLSSTHKDGLGLPAIEIYYAADDYVQQGAAIAAQEAEQFQRILAADVFSHDTKTWERRHHPCGTVIMGTDPKEAVVNHECRSFDHPNLFFATLGVMPSSGVNNPTLTGAALSLRSASIILKEI